MRFVKLTALGTFAAALALAMSINATPLHAQERGQRDERPAAGQRGPVERGPVDAAPVRRGAPDEAGRRGPIEDAPFARGVVGPGPAGPAAGLVADVVPFWERPAMSRQLALTEDQIAKLQTSYDKARPTIDENNMKMRQAGQRIAESMRTDAEPDLDALRKAVDEFSTAQKASMMAAVEHRATLQKELNQEQLADLRRMSARLRAAGGPQTPGTRQVVPEEPQTLPELPGRDARERETRERETREGEGRTPRARGEWTPEMRERFRTEREQLTPEEREEMRERLQRRRQ